ncbi:MAG: hypothetical protein NC122_05510 [Faecalibacterium sp.]|nr:hypothetical protein [Ruminococcus sp.]MCM1392898.1 hypothetical protein [Ruminococcus sp.]MCM1485645.1 hypothetical protein [Faecalibacterium sp.]
MKIFCGQKGFGNHMAKQIVTLLGANTSAGFSSLFDELYNPYKSNGITYIIKGGPGTGKSSLMRKVAEASEKKGYDTERIICSSDPDSLDGLIVPELGFCMADGTAPHVVEPQFPGAVENIINMGAFWDEHALHKKADEIRALTIENSMYHRRSARFLAAAGSVSDDTQKILEAAVDKEKVNSFAVRFSSRETPKKKNNVPGKKLRRYISGITPKGVIFLDNTVTTLASRIIGVEDEYSAVSGMLIERIGECAVRNGYDVIFCRCPMKPKDCCEHIIIPEVGLAVVTVKSEHNMKLASDRLIHAKRFIDKQAITAHKNRLTMGKKLSSELVSQSVMFLKKAKEVHDRLESCYVENMNFDGINEFSKKFVERVVG